uniref:Uncharacterized protein n=1 Tax=Cannabis sativa TaxID=3483 RepID=A0A803NHW5_CANSA
MHGWKQVKYRAAFLIILRASFLSLGSTLIVGRNRSNFLWVGEVYVYSPFSIRFWDKHWVQYPNRVKCVYDEFTGSQLFHFLNESSSSFLVKQSPFLLYWSEIVVTLICVMAKVLVEAAKLGGVHFIYIFFDRRGPSVRDLSYTETAKRLRGHLSFFSLAVVAGRCFDIDNTWTLWFPWCETARPHDPPTGNVRTRLVHLLASFGQYSPSSPKTRDAAYRRLDSWWRAFPLGHGVNLWVSTVTLAEVLTSVTLEIGSPTLVPIGALLQGSRHTLGLSVLVLVGPWTFGSVAIGSCG